MNSSIGSLSIQRGWVMDFPKQSQQFLKGGDGIVKNYFYHLRMIANAITDILVDGIRGIASRVARGYQLNAVDVFVDGFYAPKATTS